MARIRDVVFDCTHPASLARFWSAVLDDYRIAPYTEEDLEELRRAGINDPEDDPLVLVTAGTGTRLFFQRVAEPKSVKNRVHLDLSCADLATELDRVVGLGARVLARHEGWVVLADPEGNEFDLMHAD